MRKLISKHALVAIAAGGMLFSSCGDHDMFNPNYKKNEYAANWETKFGKIDPAQDWSMATTVKATVNVAREGNFTVKVYSSNPADKTQQAYLLAKTTVTGGTPATLTFDAVKGLDNVYVALINEFGYGITKKVGVENGVAMADFYATNGNRVKTRTAAEFGWELTDYMTFTRNEIEEIVNSLPENTDAAGAFNNYEFVSNGEFVIYPIYGETSANDKIGYYFYDPKTESFDARSEVTLIENLQWLGDKVQIVANNYSKHHGGNLEDGSWDADLIWWDKTPSISASNYYWGPDPENHQNKQLLTKYPNEWNRTEFEVRSKGYAINVPAGYRVGFWIENASNKFYSNRAINDDGSYYSAVVEHSSGNMFFGLEDWLKSTLTSGNYTDCNDVVFYVKGVDGSNENLPDPVDPNETPDDDDDVEMSWILACEDLGSTDDYDFNDIVLEIMKNTANNSVEVRCLAAGGTIPAYITCNGVEIGETHALLGGQTNQMINTSSFGAASEWKTLTGVSVDMSIDEIIKNISIRVTKNEGDVYATEIKAPETGEAPQMIIVPGDWEWPAERKGIETAYPEFTNWSSNASLTDWNRVKVSDKVVKRK